MISDIFAKFLEEIKTLGGILTPEQEMALQEVNEQEEVIENEQTRLYGFGKAKRKASNL